MLGGWYWGYLLAAAAFQFVYPLFSRHPDLAWRTMFWIAIVPALFTLWIRAQRAREPGVARAAATARGAGRAGTSAPEPTLSLVRIFQRDLIGTTIQTTLVIGSFMCIYYSVNFWYPTFLRDAGRPALPYLAAFNIGAIIGTACWGRLSEGRSSAAAAP